MSPRTSASAPKATEPFESTEMAPLDAARHSSIRTPYSSAAPANTPSAPADARAEQLRIRPRRITSLLSTPVSSMAPALPPMAALCSSETLVRSQLPEMEKAPPSAMALHWSTTEFVIFRSVPKPTQRMPLAKVEHCVTRQSTTSQ
eukprot:357126-Pleurochrysis_carterae.AAC.3